MIRSQASADTLAELALRRAGKKTGYLPERFTLRASILRLFAEGELSGWVTCADIARTTEEIGHEHGSTKGRLRLILRSLVESKTLKIQRLSTGAVYALSVTDEAALKGYLACPRSTMRATILSFFQDNVVPARATLREIAEAIAADGVHKPGRFGRTVRATLNDLIFLEKIVKHQAPPGGLLRFSLAPTVDKPVVLEDKG